MEVVTSVLWDIIKTNMGNNSLALFQEFYKGESLNEQYGGAVELFEQAFGKSKTEEMLRPVTLRLKEGSSK